MAKQLFPAKRHSKKKKHTYRCFSCGKTFASKKSYVKKCIYCGRRFKNKIIAGTHVRQSIARKEIKGYKG